MELYEIFYWIGLILFGGYFLYNGIQHFVRRSGMVAYAKAMGVPQAEIAILVTGLLLTLGGLGLIFQFHVLIALWFLVIFLVPVTFKMHAFWKMTDPATKATHKINFLKNLGLLGAVLMLMGIFG